VPALRGTPQSASIGANNCQVNVPAGVVNGDFMLAAIAGFKTAGVTPATPVDPAGWTKIGVASSGLPAVDNVQVAWYYRVAASEPAQYTFAITQGLGDLFIDADIIAFRDVDVTTPFNLAGVSAVGSSATPTTADLGPTTVDACWHVCRFTSYSGLITTGPSGYVDDLRYDSGSEELSHRIVTVAGATGARSVTATSADGWVAWACALEPVVGVSSYTMPYWYNPSRVH